MEGFVFVLASIGAITVLAVLLLLVGVLLPDLLIKLLVYKETKRLVRRISETEFKAEVDKVLKEQTAKKPAPKKTTTTKKADKATTTKKADKATTTKKADTKKAAKQL